ncbi:MAG: NapC/NirT family cytochrome c [Thermoanaerobaculales bacterium]|jgi:nitrate/TMAO reductase-like tetraheme cytochrome c subunit|nr:NapC/NirT family cytochrome c [Thermoanaerobaculales bacterium]
MTTPPSRDRILSRLFNHANNLVTMTGVALTTISAVVIVTFIIAEIFGAIENPYAGIFGYVVMPGFFVLGLLLIPSGMWMRRRRIRREGADARGRVEFPVFDFNEPKIRRVVMIALALTIVNAVIFGASSFIAVEKMETVAFCGETCHTVMQPEHTAYQESPHSRVACVECHIGPGASWFVKSKLDGLRQVWHTALNTYHRPVSTPLRTLRPARETCEQCHWPGKHHGDKLRTIVRHRTDEQNTPSYTVMLLKTGGGSLDLGRHGGIHWWHIESDNVIRYVAGDDRRNSIVWVELTTADGQVRTYTRDGDELPPAVELEKQARVMDCIDCHNRPTHLFHPPPKALDWVLETHPELIDLPFYKQQAQAAVSAEYATHAEGVATVRETMLEYYQSQYPDFMANTPELVATGSDLAAQVYARIAFPEMDTNWETHPNHIGHEDFPGCWRCHDDEMATDDGKHAIPMDCENCHVFLVEDASEPPNLADLVSSG